MARKSRDQQLIEMKDTIKEKYLLLKTPTKLTSDDELEKLCPWDLECKEALEELYRQQQKAIFVAM